jgi:hypothetical protein
MLAFVSLSRPSSAERQRSASARPRLSRNVGVAPRSNDTSVGSLMAIDDIKRPAAQRASAFATYLAHTRHQTGARWDAIRSGYFHRAADGASASSVKSRKPDHVKSPQMSTLRARTGRMKNSRIKIIKKSTLATSGGLVHRDPRGEAAFLWR